MKLCNVNEKENHLEINNQNLSDPISAMALNS